MSTHTPGPWTRGNGVNCGKTYAICSGPKIIARVVGDGYPIGIGRAPSSDANATLIAAAPDLLAALRECEEWISSVYNLAGYNTLPFQARQARAAIAKATGDAS